METEPRTESQTADPPLAEEHILPFEPSDEPDGSLPRMRRNTYLVIVILFLASLLALRFRTAAGVLLGGALSVFNERWLRASTGAILGVAAATGDGRLPQWTTAKFLLRHVITAAIAIAAVTSGWFDLSGIGAGLASFVGAVMIEAAYQMYLTFSTAGPE
ncbi:MAG: ATP synthase subunit I [Blastocatellia bacterium]